MVLVYIYLTERTQFFLNLKKIQKIIEEHHANVQRIDHFPSGRISTWVTDLKPAHANVRPNRTWSFGAIRLCNVQLVRIYCEKD